MSLIQGPWLVIAAAAVTAAAVPYTLLDREQPEVPVAPPAKVTAVPPVEGGGLSYALVAPPFDSDRTPGPPDPLAAQNLASSAAAAPTPPPPPPQPPVLVGLVTGGGRRGVALAKGPDGQTVTILAGQSVAGWRLVSIRSDQAVFEQGGVRHVARLDFSNKSSGAPQTAAPPPAVPAITDSAAPSPGLPAQQQNGKQ
jgi:hypothetical protein